MRDKILSSSILLIGIASLALYASAPYGMVRIVTLGVGWTFTVGGLSLVLLYLTRILK
jgi:hypothetical protein